MTHSAANTRYDAEDPLAARHDRRIQQDTAILHGETDMIESAGRLRAGVHREYVQSTALSPCIMCAGTALLDEIPRIVVGEVNLLGGVPSYPRAMTSSKIPLLPRLPWRGQDHGSETSWLIHLIAARRGALCARPTRIGAAAAANATPGP